LRVPHLSAIPAAILLAVALHPFVLILGQWIQQIYPISQSMKEQMEGFKSLFQQAPSFWLVLGLFAVVPAICEELACRGFILSGLRHTGHRWLAIAGSAFFFGLIHLVLQQQINAAIFGLVIGYVALKTESILPAMAFHCVHNALALSLQFVTPALVREHPWLGSIAEVSGTEFYYRWPVLVVCGLSAAALLWWFKSLPYHLTDEEELQETRDQEPATPPPPANHEADAILTKNVI
jgi:sodium transport system permease protein